MMKVRKCGKREHKQDEGQIKRGEEKEICLMDSREISAKGCLMFC